MGQGPSGQVRPLQEDWGVVVWGSTLRSALARLQQWMGATSSYSVSPGVGQEQASDQSPARAPADRGLRCSSSDPGGGAQQPGRRGLQIHGAISGHD